MLPICILNLPDLSCQPTTLTCYGMRKAVIPSIFRDWRLSVVSAFSADSVRFPPYFCQLMSERLLTSLVGSRSSRTAG